jgi:hypothetical protein
MGHPEPVTGPVTEIAEHNGIHPAADGKQHQVRFRKEPVLVYFFLESLY